VKDYTATTYGDRIADNKYDRMVTGTAPVDTLERLAGGGRALELGIGTGRVALPLAARGVDVHGIEASEAMVAKLRAKPGGDAMAEHLGAGGVFLIEAGAAGPAPGSRRPAPAMSPSTSAPGLATTPDARFHQSSGFLIQSRR